MGVSLWDSLMFPVFVFFKTPRVSQVEGLSAQVLASAAARAGGDESAHHAARQRQAVRLAVVH